MFSNVTFALNTLNKNNENLPESFDSHWRLGHPGEAPDGVRSVLHEIQIGRPLYLQPQHIVLDRGEVVTAPIFVQGSLLNPNVNRLSNSSFEPSRFYSSYCPPDVLDCLYVLTLLRWS